MPIPIYAKMQKYNPILDQEKKTTIEHQHEKITKAQMTIMGQNRREMGV